MKPSRRLGAPVYGLRGESRAFRYGAAVMLTLPALLITSLRPPLMANPFIVFLGAVILSALFGGLAPAFVTTALSALLIRLFFIEPRFSLYHRGNLDDAEQMGWFLLVALMLSSLVSALRRERNLIRRDRKSTRLNSSH